MAKLEKCQLSLCGIRVDALELSDLFTILEDAVMQRVKILIFNHNLHSLYLFKTNPSFASAYALANWVYVDGLPIIWMGRAAGLPLEAKNRITLLDCFESVLSQAAIHKWRVFYLGSNEETLNQGLAILRGKQPSLLIEGHHGFFLQEQGGSQKIIEQINEYRPDILFVGMGMPLQETWLASHLDELDASTIFTSGATMDYLTGHSYRPPAWAGPLGLYGIFRLFSDPRRLWKRYLVEPIYLMRHMLPHLIVSRKTGGQQS